jgi:hypothetical protein
MVSNALKFNMPVVAPINYPGLPTNLVTATVSHRYGLKIQISDPNHRQLFAMADGPVYFVPAGSDPFLIYQNFTDLPALAPGSGFVIQRVWPAAVKEMRSKLPVGVPPMVHIVYFDVDPISFRADAAAAIGAPPLSLKVLKGFGTLPPMAGPTAYQTQLLDLMLQGKAGIYFHGGTPVGKMTSNSFTLFFTSDDFVGISPVPYLRNMPRLGGIDWLGHPLIAAISNLPVPIDIYAQFKTWSHADKALKPLPDGLTARLIDENSVLSNTPLKTLPLTGGTGSVTFNLTDQEIYQQTQETEPDLMLELDLGASNPEPGLIVDPWDSSAHFRDERLGDDGGYFENFVGTRLGSFIAPMQFQIGLAAWEYLINHRPPASVQAMLQGQDRYVQPIEDSYHGSRQDPPSFQTIDEWSPLSLDFYGVKITQLPSSFPTSRALMDHIRTHFNDFYSLSDAHFWTTDSAWTNANASPVGVVHEIDLKLFGITTERGSVVVGTFDPNGGFIVNTISDPGLGLTSLHRQYHPLGGIRHWSIEPNADGSFTFFARGADRPYLEIDFKFADMIFAGAHRLWTSLQEGVAKFVNDEGGQAQILPPFARRFDWPKVRDLYWHDDLTNPWIRPPP